MRIVVLGDFHMSPDAYEVTEAAMEDVKVVRPDLVVPLGDYGPGKTIGSPEGLHTAWHYLRMIDAPMWPILGNHDLQEESNGKRRQGEMAEVLRQLSPDGCGDGFLEYDNFRIMFVTTDPQPLDDCWSIQECYVSPEQWDRLMGGIQRRRGVPIIVCSHAPPWSAGLRTVPRTHVRATNAYLDQNHNPQKWEELYRQYPEILLWFSAHYHLGHDHFDAVTEVWGTRFFQTQIHGLQTRDGTRQSRVIDVEDGFIRVSTLDHITRKLVEHPSWSAQGGLQGLMENKQKILSLNLAPACSCYVGVAAMGTPSVLTHSGRCILVPTTDGYLWEVDVASRSVMGSLHLGPDLSGVAVSGEWIWRCWEQEVVKLDGSHISRFVRSPHPESFPGTGYHLEEKTYGVAASESRVVVCGQTRLWEYSAQRECFEKGQELPGAPTADGIRIWGNQVVVETADKVLWREAGSSWERVADRADIWSVHGSSLVVGSAGQIVAYGQTKTGALQKDWSYDLPFELTKASLVYDDRGYWWLSNERSLCSIGNTGLNVYPDFHTVAPDLIVASGVAGRIHLLFAGDGTKETRNRVQGFVQLPE